MWESVRKGYASASVGVAPLNVVVTFRNRCTDQAVTVYRTSKTGSSCDPVSTSAAYVLSTSEPNAFSASINGQPSCADGTRVEFTYGANGDVSYDISTNGSWEARPVTFFNVPVRILALQNTSPTCALAQWNGLLDANSLRGVSTQHLRECPVPDRLPGSGLRSTRSRRAPCHAPDVGLARGQFIATAPVRAAHFAEAGRGARAMISPAAGRSTLPCFPADSFRNRRSSAHLPKWRWRA